MEGLLIALLFAASVDGKFVDLTSTFRTAATFIIVLPAISYFVRVRLNETTSYLVFPVKSQTDNNTAPVFLLNFKKS